MKMATKEYHGIGDVRETQKVDFKMVTFSLAEKDYGINIMKIKEIAKAGKFTYVPNSPPYVRGVYNLRGEIISIIDLRKMFNLEIDEKAEDHLENVLILRLDQYILGIVVDSIDKVIGIDSETIQPPHPLFSNINIQYMSGIVESDDKLYIILDVDRIFGTGEETHPQSQPIAKPKLEVHEEQKEEVIVEEKIPPIVNEAKEMDFEFVTETLGTFKNFYVSPINETWVKDRFKEWQKFRKEQNLEVQLRGVKDADDFLTSFYSPYTGTLWEEDYKNNFLRLLSDKQSGSLEVWNPGCGRGFESYSITSILRIKYPDARIKVWANDNDLLNVSTGPNLLVPVDSVPKYFLEAGFLKEKESGSQFISKIKDLILFEYHDILNENTFPELDIIVARDILSFLKPAYQIRLLGEFHDKLREDGILILGKNEVVSTEGWYMIEEGNVVAFKKEKG